MQLTTVTIDPCELHRQRLRNMAKRLVIELGYLESHFAKGSEDATLTSAATGIDGAIDAVNSYLETY